MHNLSFFLDKIINRMETLPNEILLHILSYLELFDLLTGFWSLNTRFNSLVCLAFSIGDNSLNTGLTIKQGLSYNKFSSLFFPLILNSSSLCFSIQRIHFDETNSIACDQGSAWDGMGREKSSHGATSFVPSHPMGLP